MPWVEALSDLPELRRCIRDLVALSTLPAIWTSYNPRQIADSMEQLVAALDRYVGVSSQVRAAAT